MFRNMKINRQVYFYLEKKYILLKYTDMSRTNPVKIISCKIFTSVSLTVLLSLSLTLYDSQGKSCAGKNKSSLVQTPLTDQASCYSYARNDVVKIYSQSACGKLPYLLNCFYIHILQNQIHVKNREIIITFRRIHRFARFSTSTFS